MIFEALVINTDRFFERGTITVRMPAFYFRRMQWDLSENYPEFMEDNDEKSDGSTRDFEVFVYSPYGGGSNFGSLCIPQVNQRGIVMAMDNHFKKMIWMGSFFKPEINKNWEVENVNIPSDDMNKEGPSGYGILREGGETKQNLLAESLSEAKEKNFIARFKTTDRTKKEGLFWEERPTSNIISIGEKESFFIYFVKNSGWEKLVPKKWLSASFSTDPEGEGIFELKAVDIDGEKERSFSLKKIEGKESIVQVVKNGEKKETTIKINEDGFILETTDDEGKEVSLHIGMDGNLLLETKKGKIGISTEEGDVELTTGKGNVFIRSDSEGKVEVVSGGEIILESEEDIKIESKSKDILLKPSGLVKISSGGDEGVLFSFLKNIVDKLESHIHVAPTGPTTPALDSSMAPLQSLIVGDKMNMKSKKLKLD